jgi:membrane protease subunit HflC
MTEIFRRHPMLSAALAALIAFTLFSTVVIVPETRQGVVSWVGKPTRILGRTEAGLAYRIPFFENVVWIDKRIRALEMERQQVLSTDQRRLEVDAFARYRVVNPLLMYLSARSVEGLEEQLRPILGSQLRNELGKRSFVSLLSPERGGVMNNIQAGLNQVARQYGVEVVDVRIKKADLPDGTPRETAFEQMRTAREQEARSIRAEGQKQAQIIRAEADAQAAQIYAAAFGKDPQFYDFYRAMQSYQTTFIGSAGDKSPPTSVILSPQNDYLREFTGRSR